MKNIFSGKINIIGLCILPVLAMGLFLCASPAFASGNPVSIAVNVQPGSTGSVDSPLSQQPAVLVEDANNNPVQGVIVTAFKASGSGNLTGGITATTDVGGLATFQGLGYNKTDAFSLSFIYDGGSPVTSNSLQLSPGAVSSGNSAISITPSSVTADGKSTADIKIQCEDQYGNLIPGADVGVSSSGSNNTFAQPATAEGPGIVDLEMSSTTAETKTISITVNGIAIAKSNTVDFVPDKISKLLISAGSPVVIGQPSQITVTGEDASGNVAVNDSATQAVLSVDNGGSLSSALVTFANGVATSSLTKSDAGSVNLTASVGNINAETQVIFVSAGSTAPAVSFQYPSDGAANISLDVKPYLEFSKIMDPATLTGDNVQLRQVSDNSIVPASVVVADGGKRAVVQSSSNLIPNTEYYLYASPAISDPSGQELSFIYKGGAFTTAQNSQPSATPAQAALQQNPQNSSGNNSVSVAQVQNGSAANPAGSVAASDGTIHVTSGSSPAAASGTQGASAPTAPNNAFGFAEAGLLGVFHNFNMDSFGNWFVANFIWVIAGLIIVLLAYLFWRFYMQ